MKKIITLIAISIVIFSCKKAVTTPTSGIFRGVFEMTGLNGGGFEEGSCTIALFEETKSFGMSTDTTSSVPYGCSGTYVITDGTKMTFSSETQAPLNGNQHIILDSIYSYTFDDTSFELSKVIDTIKYEFRFLRY